MTMSIGCTLKSRQWRLRHGHAGADGQSRSLFVLPALKIEYDLGGAELDFRHVLFRSQAAGTGLQWHALQSRLPAELDHLRSDAAGAEVCPAIHSAPISIPADCRALADCADFTRRKNTSIPNSSDSVAAGRRHKLARLPVLQIAEHRHQHAGEHHAGSAAAVQRFLICHSSGVMGLSTRTRIN